MLWCILGCIVIGYLLGCLNGAILISKLLKHEDVRQKGSGNAGLTNFHRNYGGWVSLLVVAIDIGKIFLACWIGSLLWSEQRDLAKMIAGVSAEMGHIFPCFFGFRGGKGIMGGAALALAMDWRVFAIAFVVFLVLFLTTRYVSLGSIGAAATFAVCFVICFPGQPWIYGMGIALAAAAIFMHRGNIQRLLRGEERKTHLHKNKN